MHAMKTAGYLIALGLCCASVIKPAVADIWVLEPSIALDQRFDDNYYLIPAGDGSLNATRLVGELGLSRESQSAVMRGLVRVDGLLTSSDENGDEGLNSNQLLAFDAKLRSARSRYGVRVSFKQDTPSRDIAADLSDEDSLAADTGLNISRASNVARRELILKPNFQYDLTRRLMFDSKVTFSLVDHDQPSSQDAIYRQYITAFPRLDDGSFDGVPLPYNEVTLDDVGGVFTPSGELSDFQEGKIAFGLRYKFSRIETVSIAASYSQFDAEVEPDQYAIIPFEDLIPDSDVIEIRRKPLRDSASTTTKFVLGYERLLTPTLRLGVVGGVYTNTTDTTDTLRASDRPGEEIPADRLDALDSSADGWLASISVTRDAGLTRYVGKFLVDVEPSSSGAQIETHELIGNMYRILSPRLNFSLRARALEPDRLGANREDRFARRFISFEPRLEWQYSRSWTVIGAYRYRRQKARIDLISAESNAVLFALKYTPPSKIRDAARANGL
jgi:hypothetical protein